MIRFLDLMLSGVGLVVLSPLFVILLIIGLMDTGSPLFWQMRIGKDKRGFKLVKFRSMRRDTISVPTHLINSPSITSFGRFLRKSKLDELPQLWNVFKGDMSLVGPRPCLPIQGELIELREKRGVLKVRPGITGLAQISGVDMSEPVLLVDTDEIMVRNMSICSYFKYILLTLMGKGAGDRVKEKP